MTFLDQFDVFGDSFNLTYKGETNFKSNLGRFFGVIYCWLSLSYTVVQIMILVFRANANVTISDSYFNAPEM